MSKGCGTAETATQKQRRKRGGSEAMIGICVNAASECHYRGQWERLSDIFTADYSPPSISSALLVVV